jgi:hypothetical protein
MSTTVTLGLIPIAVLLTACGSGGSRTDAPPPPVALEVELLPRETPAYPLEPLRFVTRANGVTRPCSVHLTGPGSGAWGGLADRPIVPPNYAGEWFAEAFEITCGLQGGQAVTRMNRSEPLWFEVVPFTIDLEVESGSIGSETAVVRVVGGATSDPFVVHVFDRDGNAVTSLIADADGRCTISPDVFPLPGRFYVLQAVAGTQSTARALPVFVPGPQHPFTIDCGIDGFQLRALGRKEFVVTDSNHTTIELLSPIEWQGRVAFVEGSTSRLTLALDFVSGFEPGLHTLRITTMPRTGGGPITVTTPVAVRPADG